MADLLRYGGPPSLWRTLAMAGHFSLWRPFAMADLRYGGPLPLMQEHYDVNAYLCIIAIYIRYFSYHQPDITVVGRDNSPIIIRGVIPVSLSEHPPKLQG